MAYYFEMCVKDTQDKVKFQDVDSDLCQHFGVEPDDTHWFRNWYNVVGFMFASGHMTVEAQREWWTKYTKPEEKQKEIENFDRNYKPIIEYLLEKYDVRSWYGR